MIFKIHSDTFKKNYNEVKIMKKTYCYILAFLFLLMGSAQANDTVDEMSEIPAPVIQTEHIRSGGPGCTDNDIFTTVRKDENHEYFLDVYNFDLFATITPDGRAVERKRCTIILPIKVPEGWQYAVTEIRQQNEMLLDSNVKAKLIDRLWFQGQAEETYLKHELFGPLYEESYKTVDLIETPLWSSCERDLALVATSKVQLDSRLNRYGFGEVDVYSPKTYKLNLRRCQ